MTLNERVFGICVCDDDLGRVAAAVLRCERFPRKPGFDGVLLAPKRVRLPAVPSRPRAPRVFRREAQRERRAAAAADDRRGLEPAAVDGQAAAERQALRMAGVLADLEAQRVLAVVLQRPLAERALRVRRDVEAAAAEVALKVSLFDRAPEAQAAVDEERVLEVLGTEELVRVVRRLVGKARVRRVKKRETGRQLRLRAERADLDAARARPGRRVDRVVLVPRQMRLQLRGRRRDRQLRLFWSGRGASRDVRRTDQNAGRIVSTVRFSTTNLADWRGMIPKTLRLLLRAP